MQQTASYDALLTNYANTIFPSCQSGIKLVCHVQTERVLLLSEQGELPRLPSREQEVLHYQWFADMGYVDAQRVVGRLLSQAGESSSEKGLRYVRSDPCKKSSTLRNCGSCIKTLVLRLCKDA